MLNARLEYYRLRYAGTTSLARLKDRTIHEASSPCCVHRADCWYSPRLHSQLQCVPTIRSISDYVLILFFFSIDEQHHRQPTRKSALHRGHEHLVGPASSKGTTRRRSPGVVSPTSYSRMASATIGSPGPMSSGSSFPCRSGSSTRNSLLSDSTISTPLLSGVFPRTTFPQKNQCVLYQSISYYIGWLSVGINSSILSYFLVAWLSQWFLRTRYPKWFVKYNYILGAGTFQSTLIYSPAAYQLSFSLSSSALDGGTQVMVFILSFAVFGAATGNSHLFPQWWGANQNGNYDHCLVIAD